MLEGGIATSNEAREVAMDTAVRVSPVFDKESVVANCVVLAGVY